MDRKDLQGIKVKRLAQWMKGEKAGPVKIDLEPTNTCNLRCRFCWTRSDERLSNCQYDNLLSDERILEIIDEAAQLGVVEWQVAGGWEPIVKPRLLADIAKRIKSHAMYGCITTNGTLFDEGMVRTLVEIGWDEILFSLEGADASTHDPLTGVAGSFEKSTNAMKMFKRWKEKLGKNKPDYSFHAVLTTRNYRQLADMIRLGKDIGCTGVNFEPLSVWSDEAKDLKLDEGQTREVKVHAKDALDVARKLGMHTNAENLLRPELVKKENMDQILKEEADKIHAKNRAAGGILNAPCFDPWLGMEVRVNGRVAPCRICNFDSDCQTVIDGSLSEVWFGRYFDETRQKMSDGKMPKFCGSCAAGNVADMIKMKEELANLQNGSAAGRIKNAILKRL